MNRAEERRLLDVGARALDAPLDDRQLDLLQRYLDLLERWNRSHNLSAVRERPAMAVRHLLDSLSIVAPLRRERPGGGRLLDVGSGGGLPGVVVAVAAPEWRVCCIDAVAKKTAFVRQVAGELGLGNLEARHGRVEEVSDPHDVVVSRAFGSLAGFVGLSAGARGPQGVWLAMKGREPRDEVAALPVDVEVFHVEPLQVPGLDAQRCAVWIRPRR